MIWGKTRALFNLLFTKKEQKLPTWCNHSMLQLVLSLGSLRDSSATGRFRHVLDFRVLAPASVSGARDVGDSRT